MTALITQSNYIPWKGYFDNIALADVFVLYDDVQYTRRDWRNRNQIKTSTGTKWLSIPVEASGKFFQRIDETIIADNSWIENHVSQLRHAYAKAACFKKMIGWVEEIYRSATDKNLSAINFHFLKTIAEFLGIKTTFLQSSSFVKTGNATEKLVCVCKALGVDHYLTGPAAKNYMDENAFKEKNIHVLYADYTGYPAYPQLHPPFEHGVTILDLIFNCGYEAANYMKHTARNGQLHL